MTLRPRRQTYKPHPGSPDGACPNLLSNPSFEQPLVSGGIPSWGLYSYDQNNEVAVASPSGLPVAMAQEAPFMVMARSTDWASDGSYSLHLIASAVQINSINDLKTPMVSQSIQLTATGGGNTIPQGGTTFVDPLAWSATGLPPGTAISSSGLITGAPTVPGEYSVTVKALDTNTSQFDVATFNWTVIAWLELGSYLSYGPVSAAIQPGTGLYVHGGTVYAQGWIEFAPGSTLVDAGLEPPFPILSTPLPPAFRPATPVAVTLYAVSSYISSTNDENVGIAYSTQINPDGTWVFLDGGPQPDYSYADVQLLGISWPAPTAGSVPASQPTPTDWTDQLDTTGLGVAYRFSNDTPLTEQVVTDANGIRRVKLGGILHYHQTAAWDAPSGVNNRPANVPEVVVVEGDASATHLPVGYDAPQYMNFDAQPTKALWGGIFSAQHPGHAYPFAIGYKNNRWFNIYPSPTPMKFAGVLPNGTPVRTALGTVSFTSFSDGNFDVDVASILPPGTDDGTTLYRETDTTVRDVYAPWLSMSYGQSGYTFTTPGKMGVITRYDPAVGSYYALVLNRMAAGTGQFELWRVDPSAGAPVLLNTSSYVPYVSNYGSYTTPASGSVASRRIGLLTWLKTDGSGNTIVNVTPFLDQFDELGALAPLQGFYNPVVSEVGKSSGGAGLDKLHGAVGRCSSGGTADFGGTETSSAGSNGTTKNTTGFGANYHAFESRDSQPYDGDTFDLSQLCWYNGPFS